MLYDKGKEKNENLCSLLFKYYHYVKLARKFTSIFVFVFYNFLHLLLKRSRQTEGPPYFLLLVQMLKARQVLMPPDASMHPQLADALSLL